MPDQPMRVTGTGGVCTFAETPIDYRDTWGFSGKGTVEEVKGQANIWKQRLLVGGQWSVDVGLDIPTLSRDFVPSVSIGSITGLILKKYSLKMKADIATCPGQEDAWRIQVPTGYDVSLNVESWLAPPTYGAFVAALKSMVEGSAAVAVTTPFGAFTAVIETADIGEDDKVLKETIDLPVSGASFTPGSYFAALWSHVTDCVAALASGDPSQVPQAGTIAIPPGSGLAYIESFDIDAAEGHATGKLAFQGTGEWTPTETE